MLPQRQTDGWIVHDLDVADVAGAALRTPMDATLRDDARPDAGADLDDHHVVVVDGHACPPLAQRQRVDVVVHPDRGGVPRREPLPDGVAVPAGHDGRRGGSAGPELDRTRHRDAHAPQPAGQIATGRVQLPEQLLDASKADASGPLPMSAGSA